MNIRTPMVGLLLVLGTAVTHAGAIQTTYSCTDASGVTTLTNVPTPNANCEALYTTEVADAPVAANAATVAAPAAPAASKSTPVAALQTPAANKPKSPETVAKEAAARKVAKDKAARAASDLRNNVVRETADAYARGTPKDGNPAVSRRYLKTDRATYIQQNSVVPK